MSTAPIAKVRYWDSDFCGCCNAIGPCLAIFCFGQCGLACVHCCIASEAGYSPLGAFFADACCGAFGSAWNRMRIRQAAGIPGDYHYDCVVYSQGCACCYGTQEYIQIKNRRGRIPNPQK